MQLENEKVILRDMIESDIDDIMRWFNSHMEWQDWDAPWEDNKLDDDDRKKMISKLNEHKDDKEMRYRFEICINDESKQHIGWINIYEIDEEYKYTHGDGRHTIGINIPEMTARRKGYATAAWNLVIEYLLAYSIKDIYTQTWSGNYRLLGLADKIGFEECNREVGIREVRGKKYDDLTFKLNLSKLSK